MREINTVQDLMNDEELSSYVTEDLEDFDNTAVVTYAIWAIGYDVDSCITDTEMYLGEFADPDLAVEKAKALTLADIIHLAAEEDDGSEPNEDVAYVTIEVETVVDDEEEGSMNVGTIFKKDIWLYEEPDDEELIHVKDNEYTLDEDGNLIISCDQFNHLNKNDRIKVMYDDEDNTPVLTYTVKSKTTDNKFICEFEY